MYFSKFSLIQIIRKKVLRVLRFGKHFLEKKSIMGYVFMLHRIDNYEELKLFANENMKVSPEFLDAQIKILKKKYDFISVSELLNRLERPGKRKFVMFTFDDGYKDNLYNALSVFKKHCVPFTVFIATDFPDQKAILWWYELEDLIVSNYSITLSNGVTYPCGTEKEKNDSFLLIRNEILKLDQRNLSTQLDSLFGEYKIDWYSKVKKLCLTWDEVYALGSDPLVTIGAHTMHHFNLKNLASSAEVYDEVFRGMKLIEQFTKKMPFVFAYPFGSKNEVGFREIDVLDSLDMSFSFLSYGGAIRNDLIMNRNALPRIMFTQNFSVDKME